MQLIGVSLLLAILLCVSLLGIVSLCFLTCREMDARLRAENKAIQNRRELRKQIELLSRRLQRARFTQLEKTRTDAGQQRGGGK